MTFSTQAKVPEVTVGRSENRLDGRSTLKTIFLGREGLRAGWRLLMFLAISIVLLAAFVLIRAGGVQGFLAQQRSASQVTVTPLLMGGSEAIAFLIICFAALAMAKSSAANLANIVYPWPKRWGKIFGRGRCRDFWLLAARCWGSFCYRGSASLGSPCTGRR